MYFPQEIRCLFALAGLRNVNEFGGYGQEPSTEKSDKQIYILEKQE